jgi:epsilon-lactone hydrolase
MNTSKGSKGVVVHPIALKDAAVVGEMRKQSEPAKGKLLGIAARPVFDEIIGHTSAPAGVEFREDTLGGVSGWWAHPAGAHIHATLLYLHGGWYAWGTSKAYRNFVGHIAARVGAPAFAPDYRLAPEHPFPAAVQDAEAVYRALLERQSGPIAIVGDSAGGGLSLVLTAAVIRERQSIGTAPVGTVALSPLNDLTLSGGSWETREAADPYFTRAQGLSMAPLYVGAHDPKDPLISPVFGDLAGLPPIRIHVGEDEVLLDDSLRYVERAVAAGVDARVDVWQGMPHVFLSAAGQLAAADEALQAVGTFLAERLAQSR